MALGTNGTNPVQGLSSPHIQLACPLLTPRLSPPTSVKDLRPDDIRVIAGIGDSVMAGFAAKGIKTRFISTNTFQEDRGVSFAMGGDDGAVTIPNLFQFYSRDLYGSSVGSQLITVCFGPGFCPKGQYRPKIGGLNAAQSGARSANLDHEIDYLIKQLDEGYKSKAIKKTDWKFLTFFVGSNDVCHSCFVPESLPQSFSIDILAAIDRLRLTIPYVLVQIVGLFHIDQIFDATQAYPSYCRPFSMLTFSMQNNVCECAHTTANRTMMRDILSSYNSALQNVVEHFNSPQYASESDSFGIFFQPLSADVLSFPIEAIR
ncbi:hypothetical protein BDF14DRAFT_1731692 [Spinellus fusiger]|nr:hypothetical protein BDF14DRAFT_1731692 [Spinellus fusiger]